MTWKVIKNYYLLIFIYFYLYLYKWISSLALIYGLGWYDLSMRWDASKFDTGHSKWTEIIKIYEKVVSKIWQSKIRHSTSQW